MCSLVPRPSYCPVFDLLQYAQAVVEGLVHFNNVMSMLTSASDHKTGQWEGLGMRLVHEYRMDGESTVEPRLTDTPQKRIPTI